MTGAVTGLLLAAGRGRRFGANKMIARLPQGDFIGVRAASRLAGAVDAMTVVIRTGDLEAREAFSKGGFDVIECPDADRGMAHSLRCGVMHSNDAVAWVVALGDMPYLETRTVERVVSCFRKSDAIIVPRCRERAGHPVVFPARYYAELIALRGDTGARAIIDAHTRDITWLDTEDEGVLRDIDAPEDVGSPDGA